MELDSPSQEQSAHMLPITCLGLRDLAFHRWTDNTSLVIFSGLRCNHVFFIAGTEEVLPQPPPEWCVPIIGSTCPLLLPISPSTTSYLRIFEPPSLQSSLWLDQEDSSRLGSFSLCLQEERAVPDELCSRELPCSITATCVSDRGMFPASCKSNWEGYHDAYAIAMQIHDIQVQWSPSQSRQTITKYSCRLQ